MTSRDPLGPEAILRAMTEALPTQQKDDTTSVISSSYEALGLFVHACMTNLGFRLLGFDEDKKIGMGLPPTVPPQSSAPAPTQLLTQRTSPESECQSLAPRLPPSWNARFGSFSFVYAHTQSSMTFVVKVDRLGTKAAIRALAAGDERIHSLDLTARDYVSSAALPLRIPRATASDEEDRTNLPAALQDIFISPTRIRDLASLLKVSLVQKLVPALSKEGYEEERRPDPDDRAVAEDLEQVGRRAQPPPRPPQPRDMPDPARPYPFHDPLAALPPRRPMPAGDFPPPGFEDEYEINRPPRPLGGGMQPPGIGYDDLWPPGLGPHDPLRPSFGGGLPRPGGGGGMYPAFDDPLFGGRRGGGGGDPLDPQVPPGARYDDPTGGYGGLPRFGGGRPGASGGNNPFGDII